MVPGLEYAGRSGGWCAGSAGGRGRCGRGELRFFDAESGPAGRGREFRPVLEDGSLRPGDLADPALGIGLVGMLVGDSPERGRQDKRDHGGRHQESGEWADVLHREGTCAF